MIKKEEKKILFFMTSLRMGGGERVSVDLMNTLASSGFQVFLVVMEYEGLYKEQLSSKVIVKDLKTKKISVAFFKFLRCVFVIKPITIFSSSIHFNVLVIFARLITFRRSMKVIIRIGSPFSLLFKEFRSFKDRKILFWMTKFLYPFADTIICVAKCVEDDLRSFVRLRDGVCKVVYSPKNVEDIVRKSQEEKPIIFGETQEPHFLFVGRLTSAKDPGTLLEAFNLYKKENRKGTLLFVGDGGLLPLLEQKTKDYQISDSVVFLGPQNNPYSYMKHSTSIVLSSVSEGLPNVLVEALILEKPVVSTDCFPGGAQEIILGNTEPLQDNKESALGIVVPPRNPEKLKDALVRVIEKSDLKPHLPNRFWGRHEEILDIF